MKPGTTEKILQTRAAQGQRGREQDDGIDHGVRAPLTPKTRQDHAIHRTWHRDPGEADISGIDTKGETPPRPRPPGGKRPKPKRKDEKQDKGSLWVKEKKGVVWVIVGSSKAKREQVHQTVLDNFSKKERANFNKVVIEIGSGGLAKAGAAGYYAHHQDLPRSKKAGKALDNWIEPKVSEAKLKELSTRRRELTKKVGKLHSGKQPVTEKEKEAHQKKLDLLRLERTQLDILMSPQDHHYIKLGADYTRSTTTHELVHHLRHFREPGKMSSSVKHYSGKDMDIEESATDLETIGRHNSWRAQGFFNPNRGKLGRPTQSGYYQDIAKKAKPNAEVYRKLEKAGVPPYEIRSHITQHLENQDRAILLQDPNGKKTTGKLTKKQLDVALERVNKDPDSLIDDGRQSPLITKRVDNRYPQTVISQLGKKGITGQVAERVDRYYASIGADGSTITKLHIRGAGDAKNAPLAKDILKKSPGKGTIVEYHDGKARVIGQFSNPAGPPIVGYDLVKPKSKRKKRGLYL